MAGYKETPRQKMIAMMYLVLTALLALNVSKQILDAFLVVNKSMLTTNEILADKIGTVYSQFSEQYRLNPEKVGEHFERATLAREYSEEMISYIENLTYRLIAYCEREDSLSVIQNYYEVKERPDPLHPSKLVTKLSLNLRSVPGKDKFDRSTTFFITQGRAVVLKDKIDEYRLKMEELIPEGYRDRVNIGLSTNDDYYNADGASQSWEQHHFYHTIVAADVTILNKIIAEIQITESDVVSELFSEITLSDFKFGDVTAAFIPKTNYIIKGQKYEAKVMVAAYDSKQNPKAFIQQGATAESFNISNAREVPGRDGIVILEWDANTQGLQRVAGVIEILDPDGAPVQYPFYHEYIVAPPSLTVAAKKMNVFYRAVDNPVSISAPGIAKEKIRPWISIGTITRDPNARGDWIVRMPRNATKATVGASAEYEGSMMNMGSFEFRVKRVPDPVAEIAGLKEGEINRNTLLAANAIIPKMYDFEFDLNFIVTSFTMATIINGDWLPKRTSGNRFSSEMQDIIRNSRRGQKFFFENIQAEGPDGSKRTLGTINLTIQ
jgi:gliding motility-associated protein GldM